VNNLRKVLAAIFSLVSFPPMPGTPAYKLWEARLQELSVYVQRYPIVEWRGSAPLVQEIGVAAAPGGGAANATVRRAAAGAWLGLSRPTYRHVAPARNAYCGVTSQLFIKFWIKKNCFIFID
jgi:hypothetical protein